MAHIGHHPAPGLGELIPGWFVVPSNPIAPVHRIPHIGELLPASFPVPQNPLIAAISTPQGYGLPQQRRIGGSGLQRVPGHGQSGQSGQGGMGCGCSTGCGSGMCGNGMCDDGLNGLSGLGLSGAGDCGCHGGMCGCGMGFLEAMDPMTIGLIVGGLALTYFLMAPGGSGYRQKKAELQREYSGKLSSLRSKERGYKRVARGATRRLAAGAAQL